MPRKTIVLTSFLSFFFCCALAIAKPTASNIRQAGMSAERLERIDSWLNGMVERREAAGFVTYIARKGITTHHKAFGTRGMSVVDPMPKNALFDIASMTKPVTAIATMLLVEEGRLTLATDISKFLPEYKKPLVRVKEGEPKPAKRGITVRNLLTHTSGVSDPRSRAEGFSFATLADHVADMANAPLEFAPGDKWLYGDSFDVLGALVEAVAEVPLDRFVQSRILAPLGMHDTHYWPPPEKNQRRAILVVRGKDDLLSRSRIPEGAAERASYIGGASGLYSSAENYGRFCQMLLNNGRYGNQRILSPRSVELIASNHVGDMHVGWDQSSLGFGLGFAVIKDTAENPGYYSPGSYFWGGSQGTLFWIDPKEQLVGVLMVQVRPGGSLKLRDTFSSLVYSAIVE